MIRTATTEDASSIVEIYNHYIEHSAATFELEPIDAAEMSRRIKRVQEEFMLPWLVMEIDHQIVGYAYATQWKTRKAYARTCESSIYFSTNSAGKGYGPRLYGE
ncbi:MAG: GNAT family N-acetyltransferase, partial [Ekhidna sp.]|nr:GNAT family N-acetyltransferase [Ekhidna sp.]